MSHWGVRDAESCFPDAHCNPQALPADLFCNAVVDSCVSCVEGLIVADKKLQCYINHLSRIRLRPSTGAICVLPMLYYCCRLI